MITCPNCDVEQEPGNFCESCGKALELKEQNNIVQPTPEVVTNNEGPTQSVPPQQPNPTIEKVKKESGLYWNYSLARMKNPSLALKDGEESFMSSIITAILLPLSIAIFFYAIVNNTIKTQFDMLGGGGLPFFPIVSRLFIVILILVFAGLVANFITLKIAKHPFTFKQLLARYTGVQVPFTAFFVVLAILGLLGILSFNPNYIEENIWMFVLLNIILFVLVFINPILLAFDALSQQKHKHTYYFSLLSLLFNLVILYILVYLLAQGLITSLEDIFDSMMW